MTEKQSKLQPEKYQLQFIAAYSTFSEGKPIPIPYVVDGLLTQGGFSVLGAKPKQGKSSISRYAAVAVTKGADFLDRTTVQGEVILISLEDPRNHVDNCLSALGYDPATDAAITILEKLPKKLEETIEVLGDALTKLPHVRLVIADTLMKMLRVKDANDYIPMMTAVEQLRNLARTFPHLHILGLSHCKKVASDDPFDALLGSTALRGEPDCNIAIYKEQGQRVIVTEVRIGRNIPATILDGEIIESAGADVVKGFTLGADFELWKGAQTDKKGEKRKASYGERIITYLSGRSNETATQMAILEDVEGKRENVLEAIHELAAEKVVTMSGTAHSSHDPLSVKLNRGGALNMHDFISKFKKAS